MAYNAIDIARKIVSRTDVEHGDTISNLKLQKLLYFVQGFHLASFGEPLFDEEMIAWTYGPVVPEVYDTYKKYRSRSINTAGIIDDVQLSPEAAALFDKVYLEYSRYSAVALMQMTHSAGPWLHHQVGEVLPKSEIRDYFLTLRLPDVAPVAAAPRQFDEANMQRLISLSAPSWKGVKDADAWVHQLRQILEECDMTPEELYAAIERDIKRDGCVVLTDAMRESLAKAQESLAQGRCLTEDMFQTRFAKWL